VVVRKYCNSCLTGYVALKKNILKNSLLLIAFIFCSAFATSVSALTLTRDTVWSGEVFLQEDILVPRGVTLTIRPGTRIKVSPAESTKTDPEYVSPLTEITVRGVLRAEGSDAAPIEFSGEPGAAAGSWAGVLIDGGAGFFSFCTLKDAENAIQVFAGSVDLRRSLLKGNRYGLVAQGSGSRVVMSDTNIRENDYGQTLFGVFRNTSCLPYESLLWFNEEYFVIPF